MKTYKNLYQNIFYFGNLFIAYKKARKDKTKKIYVKEFEKDLIKNLFNLEKELKDQTYNPLPLKTFILRDPKTRKISKSNFRDRIIHHALIRIIEPIFEKSFIYDSCANQKNKGNLFALKRLETFQRKISKNLTSKAFCLKADIKHYFEEVNHKILIEIIKTRIKDEKVIWLIKKILSNYNLNTKVKIKGMPLGNLTSQFFANVYLNELDYFVKHKLKSKYYIRYVDDFIILHKSKTQLDKWKKEIDNFLKNNLNLKLHKQKSRIINLSQGVDFVGFRNFYHFKLLRKRSVIKMGNKIRQYLNRKLHKQKLLEIFQGWNAYAKWANTYKIRKSLVRKIYANPVFSISKTLNTTQPRY